MNASEIMLELMQNIDRARRLAHIWQGSGEIPNFVKTDIIKTQGLLEAADVMASSVMSAIELHEEGRLLPTERDRDKKESNCQ